MEYSTSFACKIWGSSKLQESIFHSVHACMMHAYTHHACMGWKKIKLRSCSPKRCLRSPRSHHDSDKHHQILTLSHETQREICLLPFHDHQEIESWHGIAVISSPLETTSCYQMFDLYTVSTRLFCFCFCFPNTKYPRMVLELLVVFFFFFFIETEA